MELTAREAALSALIACRRQGAWSEGILKELLHGMERREAALASRLCYGVLQNRILLDHWLDAYVKGKLQPVVRDILRLGLYQIQFNDKIPASAAVHQAVEQCKKHANAQAARLVNGVLRNILRAGDLPLPEDPGLRYSHPAPLQKLLEAEFGKEKAGALMRCHNEAPETSLQLNPLLGDLQSLQTELEASGCSVKEHPWLENCLYVTATGSLESLPAFREGRAYVQDAAAKLSVLSAGIQPGMRVLDCCAAPGGKSFAAAMCMENRGKLVSCDIHPHKLQLIEKGAQRLGITILSTRLQDASKPVEEFRNSMDVVLADVPCSGLGVIRKKPDIRYKDLKQTEALPAIQSAILAQQAEYVKPGGVLLYSTCTILRRENEQVVDEFLKNYGNFSLEEIQFPPKSGLSKSAMATLLPCDQGTDGFFICKLRRKP
ncbi:MAG: 16S rRNA (cytosine(967)-C(5))-methyltransferase RsmB [Oscillospiraceae bacterium]|nr:16S rRNA (cytosine(967)-C(5))-methyltransferase RsmB [Oscillospiraceae bacterium]